MSLKANGRQLYMNRQLREIFDGIENLLFVNLFEVNFGADDTLKKLMGA